MYGIGQQIIHVNGENGARAFQMMPNSSALLLDDTAPLIWLAQTDGAGYQTVTPFEIKPYTPPKPIDINELMSRLERIEDKLNESNTATNESSKRTRNKSNDEIEQST